ncbi:MAG TPA: VWA domain-containing protein, partial [Trebonia sp.]|nr:VWA domain-containing protein [Trebonia sp.]
QDQAGEETEPPASGQDGTPRTAPAPPAGGEPSGVTVRSGAPYRPRLLRVQGLGDGAAGRRSRAISSRGHRIGARRSGGGAGGLHLLETLFAAAGKQGTRRRSGDRVELRREDLRIAIREGREANLILFCVDASGSMAARKRMTQVKTAIVSLLLDAYRRRDKVGLITFRGQGAELALPPTHSADIAAARLDELPAGGRTPLAEGLLEAARVLLRERRRDSRLRPLLIVVTDGRATSGAGAVSRSLRAADYVAGLGISTVVIDGESGPMRLGLAARLAERLGAEHLPVAEVSAGTLTATVREHTSHVEGAA